MFQSNVQSPPVPLGLVARFFLTLALAAIGVAGNLFSLSILFNVDFIFGSAAAVLAIVWLGLLPGLVVGFAAALYTWVIWEHPYAVVIFTVEALVVGFLVRRRGMEPVLADGIYWMLAGIPLVVTFYAFFLDLGWVTVEMIAVKQALNGVFNALLATLFFALIRIGKPPTVNSPPGSAPGFVSLQFAMLLTFTLAAGTIPLVLEANKSRQDAIRHLARDMNQLADLMLRDIARADWPSSVLSQGYLEALPNWLHDSQVQFLGFQNQPLAQTGGWQDPWALEEQIMTQGLTLAAPGDRLGSLSQWRAGLFVFERPAKGMAGLSAIRLQYPAAALIQPLTIETRDRLRFLGVLCLAGVGFAMLATLWFARPLRKLNDLTASLTEQVRWGRKVDVPHYPIREIDELGQTLNQASSLLQRQFSELEGWRVNLERRVEEQTAAIAQTKNLLQRVLDASTQVAIIATNSQGVITLFNRGAEQMLGYAADEVVGRETPALFHVPEEMQARGRELSEALGEPVSGFRVFTALAQQQGSDDREWTYVRSDGNRLPVWLAVTPVQDEAGAIQGYLGLATDISQRKEVEQMKDEFVATVSHELRTPLTSIIGAVGLVAGGKAGAVPAKAQAMLDMALNNGERLKALVNDLLDMEKLISGRMTLHVESVDLSDQVAESIAVMQVQAAESRVELGMGALPGVRVLADPLRLQQVLTNLLSNAIKFSPERGEVRVSAEWPGSQVEISVTDAGPGISPAHAEAIFGRFYQVDSTDARPKEGTGLGLSICKALVEQMNGSIGVAPAPEKGSRFWFTLPCECRE